MKHLSRTALACSLAAAGLLPQLAQAATVSAAYSLVSGATWQAQFTFGNAAGNPPVPGVTVFFDHSLYANLSAAMAPGSWQPLAVQPDPALSAAGFFDAYAPDPADALQPGQTLGGFTVRFDLLGGGTPGTLRYEFYELPPGGGFTLLASGTTTTVPAGQVPAPGTLWLGTAALAALAVPRRRRAAQQEAA